MEIRVLCGKCITATSLDLTFFFFGEERPSDTECRESETDWTGAGYKHVFPGFGGLGSNNVRYSPKKCTHFDPKFIPGGGGTQ